ncbi:hypothetical protein [Erythrobacter sp. QSSC1-22B]|uniref:hypothetical protein n=1 Tax=Erythrobacter sp. QSSC1-22B TaxID=1860125 RepID=UPI000833E0C6|nr:hypothetical protein [Erythrobacter sp. QSSC1-22B]
MHELRDNALQVAFGISRRNTLLMAAGRQWPHGNSIHCHATKCAGKEHYARSQIHHIAIVTLRSACATITGWTPATANMARR